MAATSSNAIESQLAEAASEEIAAESNAASNELGTELEIEATADGLPEMPPIDTETDSGKRQGHTARDRIQQLVGNNSKLSTEIESLRGNHEQSQESIKNLTDLLAQSREDSELVTSIRQLAGNPKYASMVQQLDKVLRGEDIEDVDTSKMSGEEKTSHVASLLEKRIADAEEANAVLQSDQLIGRADTIAEKWLESLPVEYTADDREVIGRLWTGLVDWDGLDNSGDAMANLQPHLKDTFQEAVDMFKQPRGNMVEAGSAESLQESEPTETQSPEELLAEAVANQDYGAFSVKDGDSKLTPDISDEDFSSDLAAVIRASRD